MSKAATLTQTEIITLSGYMISATATCSQRAAGLAGTRSTQPVYREIADEIRAIRDTVTLLPVNGPQAIPF